MRRVTLILVVALLAAACSDSADTTTTAAAPEATTATIQPPATTQATTSKTHDTEASETADAAVPWPDDRIHPTLVHDPVGETMVMLSGLSKMQRTVDRRDAWSLDTSDFPGRS